MDVLPAAVRPGRPAAPGGLLRMDRYHYGSHCYLLSPAGAGSNQPAGFAGPRVRARRLVGLSLPAELHVDFWMGILAVAGHARGFLAPRSLATQRCTPFRSSIPHFHWSTTNVKIVLPEFTVRTLLLFLSLTAALLVVVIGRQQKEKNPTPCG